MYRERDMWEDALRVAKVHGGLEEHKELAYTCAKTLSMDTAVKLLTKLRIAELVVDAANSREAAGHCSCSAHACSLAACSFSPRRLRVGA